MDSHDLSSNIDQALQSPLTVTSDMQVCGSLTTWEETTGSGMWTLELSRPRLGPTSVSVVCTQRPYWVPPTPPRSFHRAILWFWELLLALLPPRWPGSSPGWMPVSLTAGFSRRGARDLACTPAHRCSQGQVRSGPRGRVALPPYTPAQPTGESAAAAARWTWEPAPVH